jgi:hypothetical protein
LHFDISERSGSAASDTGIMVWSVMSCDAFAAILEKRISVSKIRSSLRSYGTHC